MPLLTAIGAALLIPALSVWAGPPAGPVRPFGLGPVDLVALAAAMPPLDLPEKVETPPGAVTNRELRATAQRFQEKEIWKPLEVASHKAAAGGGASDYTSSQANSGMEALAVLAMTAIANAFGWATSESARDAARCRDFLSARGAAIWEFLKEVPDDEAPATGAALDRWEKLSRGVRSYPACAGIRSP